MKAIEIIREYLESCEVGECVELAVFGGYMDEAEMVKASLELWKAKAIRLIMADRSTGRREVEIDIDGRAYDLIEKI